MSEELRGRILALTLTIVTFAVIWLGIIAPLIGWYNQRADELHRQRHVLADMRASVGSVPDLVRQTRTIQAAGVNLLPGVSDAVADATLQEKVQGMAVSVGATLSSIEMLPTQTRGPYRQVGLRVAVTAPYPVLIKLLADIGQDQSLMLIDDVEIRAAMGLGRTATTPVSATFDVTAYRAVATQALK